jgi:hypothetical protein
VPSAEPIENVIHLRLMIGADVGSCTEA